MPVRRPPRQPPFDLSGAVPVRPPAEQERSARPFVPESKNLSTLREAAAKCQGCDLYLRATQVVFGAGTKRAVMMLVGEQPGDKEDLEGKPFVGPAGAMLTRALSDAGIDPATVYVTNAVKHFSWEPRGKRRIHKKPRASEIRACRPWLEAEIASVRPRVIVALGATAAQSLLGTGFKLTAQRGQAIASPLAEAVVATIHPSAILRAPDTESRRAALAEFVRDLKAAAAFLGDTQ
jgi:uracil-DNA glycosylase family protein